MPRREFLASSAAPRSGPSSRSPVASAFFTWTSRPYRVVYHPEPAPGVSGIAATDGPGLFEFVDAAAIVSALPDRPHPDGLAPTAVRVFPFDAGGGSLVRSWPTSEVPRCGLCKVGCNAVPRDFDPSVSTCFVALPPGDVPAELALHRCDFPTRHDS